MSEYCEGCRTHAAYKKIYSICIYADFDQNSKCPCSTCIVKVMCGTACDLFKDFKHNAALKDHG